MRVPFTTQESGSARAAIAVGTASEIGCAVAAGASTWLASAPSRYTPSATTLRQLAGRPARHGSQAAALRVGIDDHAGPDRHGRDGLPHGRDPPDHLVPEDRAGSGRVAGWDVEHLEVGAADPAGLDLDEDVVGRRDRRQRTVLHHEPALAGEHRCEHQATSSRDRSRPRTARTVPASTSSASVAPSITVAIALTSGVTPNLIWV